MDREGAHLSTGATVVLVTPAFAPVSEGGLDHRAKEPPVEDIGPDLHCERARDACEAQLRQTDNARTRVTCLELAVFLASRWPRGNNLGPFEELPEPRLRIQVTLSLFAFPASRNT